jgi:hypothetical protein
MSAELSPKLLAAREFIQEKNYVVARSILMTLSHDITAKKWLLKLDEVAPIPASTDSILRADLTLLEQELISVEAENARYSGGLIKSLIEARMQVLKMTKALIEQKIFAVNFDAPMVVVLQTTNVDIRRADSIEQEMQKQKKAIDEARLEASKYVGGVVHAMKLSTVATLELTLANLQQQYVLAKHGINLPATSHLNAEEEVPTSSSQVPTAKKFEITKIDSRVTESNSSWSRFAWRLTVQSMVDVTLRLDAKIEFQDAEGFILDEGHAYNLILPAREEKTFTGFQLINANLVRKVDSINANVKAS